MLHVDKTFNRSVRAGLRVLRGVAAIVIRWAVRPPLIAVAALSLAALAGIAAFQAAALDPVSAALAQQKLPSQVRLENLFDLDLADLKTTEQLKDAVKNAYQGCSDPRVRFQLFVPDGKGAKSLAQERADALAAALPSLGLDSRHFTIEKYIGMGGDNVTVVYDCKLPPWLDMNCESNVRPYHYYQRDNRYKLPPDQVRCLEKLDICGTWFVREKIVDTKPGCDKNAFWKRPENLSDVCCEEFKKALESKQPCDPKEDLDCDGIPNDKDEYLLNYPYP